MAHGNDHSGILRIFIHFPVPQGSIKLLNPYQKCSVDLWVSKPRLSSKCLTLLHFIVLPVM